MKILLDTNFLVYCAKQKIDYVEEIDNLIGDYNIVVLSSVRQEIEKIKKQAKKARDKQAAELALQILNKNIKENKIKIIKTEEKEVDEAILKLVKEKDVVATMDKELKKRLKGKAQILSIRKGKKLEVL
mgnify:CR=1 FL=1